jgi:hypothetical protein
MNASGPKPVRWPAHRPCTSVAPPCWRQTAERCPAAGRSPKSQILARSTATGWQTGSPVWDRRDSIACGLPGLIMRLAAEADGARRVPAHSYANFTWSRLPRTAPAGHWKQHLPIRRSGGGVISGADRAWPRRDGGSARDCKRGPDEWTMLGCARRIARRTRAVLIRRGSRYGQPTVARDRTVASAGASLSRHRTVPSAGQLARLGRDACPVHRSKAVIA